MGNCHPDGKRLYLRSPEPRFHSENDNQRQRQRQRDLGHAKILYAVTVLVSGAIPGQAGRDIGIRPLETSRGAPLNRYLKVTFGLDVFGQATLLIAPCFVLLVAASLTAYL